MLARFVRESYAWHLATPGRRPCEAARVAIYRYLIDRHGGDAVMRHVRQTAQVLDRAEAAARLAASRERNLKRVA